MGIFDNNMNNGGGTVSIDAFDPTSSATTTAVGAVFVGLCSLISAGFVFGRYRQGDKSRIEYQSSMLIFVSGLVAFCAGLYIAFAYD